MIIPVQQKLKSGQAGHCRYLNGQNPRMQSQDMRIPDGDLNHQPTKELPNYVIPKMDGIGANEYIVTVTQNVVDFFSAGDTPLRGN